VASVKFPKILDKHISLNIGETEEKKRWKSNLKHFRNFSVKYKKGVNLVIRVRLEIFFIKSLGGKHLSFSL